MKNYKVETITTEQKALISITCDKCGTEYDDLFDVQEFLNIKFVGGYSSVFGDMNMVECDLCQHCLKVLIGDVARIRDYYDTEGLFSE